MAALRKIYSLNVLLVVFSLLFSGKTAISQSNYLYRKLSVSFTNIPLEKALAQISETGNFTFSYNSKNFEDQKLVSLNVQNKTVAKSLDKLFNNSVRYKVVGTHVILMKKNPPKQLLKENRPNEYILTGYVINSRTGEKIKEATVYEIGSRIVSLSNSDGFYSLTIPAKIQIHGLSYSKHGYLDTVIMVEPAYKKTFDIYLTPREISIQKIESKSVNLKLADLHNRQVVNVLVPNEAKIISDNLVIHDNRKFQVSLIPYIGTNKKLSGSVDNTFSFNILAGYSGGINGFEMGGLLNIVRRDVNGSQISGLANIVGGNTKYFQLAGFFNKNSGTITGAQIAGFSNVVLDTITGIQLAGFQNTLHGHMNGIQIAGFNNVTTQHVDGIQLTCFVNVALKDVKLAQISCFANYCDNVDGGQLSGFVNFAKGDVNWGQVSGFVNYGKSVKGFQMAGFSNISANEVSGGQIAGGINYGKTGGKFQISGYANIATEEINGVQLTGLLNYAKKVNGYQIAILNVSDTIESGLPIGLFSFVKKGFHRFEISTNEIFDINIAYKSGVKKLYNSIRFGYNPSEYFSAGYGIGTQTSLGNNFNFNLDLSSDIVFETNSFNYIGNLNKLSTTFDYNISKEISVFAGPSLNVSLISFDNTNNSYPGIAPYSIYTEIFSENEIKMWVGGIFGLSITL